MKDWNEVKKDKELLEEVEHLVNEAGDYYDDIPEEICSRLNELTGNNCLSNKDVQYGFK